MVKINRQQLSIGVGILGALMFFAVMKSLFAGPLLEISSRLSTDKNNLIEQREFISRKKEFEERWESRKSLFDQMSSVDEQQTSWIKELLTYSQSQALVLDKIEPAGIKEGQNGRESVIFLSFQGGIGKLNHFLYHLLDEDAAARMVSLNIHQNESEKKFTYELTLARVLK